MKSRGGALHGLFHEHIGRLLKKAKSNTSETQQAHQLNAKDCRKVLSIEVAVFGYPLGKILIK